MKDNLLHKPIKEDLRYDPIRKIQNLSRTEYNPDNSGKGVGCRARKSWEKRAKSKKNFGAELKIFAVESGESAGQRRFFTWR